MTVDPPHEARWYFAQPTKVGPVDWESLRQLAARGQLQPTDLIVQEGRSEWVQADTLRGLFFLLAVPAEGSLFSCATLPAAPGCPETLNPAGTATPPLPSEDVPGYAVLEKLGQGGMGIVYKAQQLGLNRIVALKKILGVGEVSTELLARFRTEAETLARLDHPNIVQVYEVGEVHGRPYFAMEFCAGGSLAARLSRAPLVPPEAAALVRTLARAMDAAHRRGVIHRDLKPANILLNGEPAASAAGLAGEPAASAAGLAEPKITDFGLARKLDEVGQTQPGVLIGSPSYMAPEQAAGKVGALTAQTDVYGLGAILYEGVTGRPPFRAATVNDTLWQVIRDDPVPPTQLNGRVPRDLETICLKCLHKEPSRRYDSAAALADDLERWLGGEPIRARPVGTLERAVKWTRRRPAVATLLAVGVLALVLLFGGERLLTEADRARERADFAADQERLKRLSAEQEAVTHQYTALLQSIRQRSLHQPPGWTWAGLSDLEKLGVLSSPARDVAELRSEIASCLSHIDLRPQLTLARNFAAGAVAWSPDGRLVAFAQARIARYVTPIEVHLHEADSGKRLLTLSASPSLLRNEDGLIPDGGRALAFSPDGRRLALGTRGGRIYLWDLTVNPSNPVSCPPGEPAHTKSVQKLAFSADGAWLFSAAEDQVLRRWECASGKVTASFPGPTTFDLHHQGEWLICQSDKGTTELLDTRSLKPARTSLPYQGSLASLSPDGRWCALTEQPDFADIQLVEVETATSVRKLRDPALRDRAHQGRVSLLQFSRTGELLLSGCTAAEDRTLRLWDVAGGRLAATLSVGAQGTLAAALSPTGRQLVRASNGEVVLYEVAGRTEHEVLALQPRFLKAVRLSPDGQTLVCASEVHARSKAQEAQHLSLWTVANGRQRGWRTVLLPACGYDAESVLALHPSANLVAYRDVNAQLSLWDLHGGKSLSRLPARNPVALAFSLDGRQLWGLVNASLVHSWDWQAGSVRTSWNNKGLLNQGYASLRALAVGQRWLLAGGHEGKVYVLDPEKGELLNTWSGPGGQIVSALLDRTESLALIGTEKGIVRLLAVPEGKELADVPAHEGSVVALSLSDDGRLLATGSSDRSVRLWLRTGASLHPLLTLRSPTGSVSDLHLSADGNKLAVLWANETGVRFWHLDRLRQRLDNIGLGEPAWTELGKQPVSPRAVPLTPVQEHENHTDSRSAEQALRRGERLSAAGDTGHGLLWLVRALELAQASQPALIPEVRRHLAGNPSGLAMSLLATSQGHTNAIASVHFSPDGKRLATGSQDGTLRLWHAETGKAVGEPLPIRHVIERVVFSPDSRTVAIGTVHWLVWLWDVASGQLRALEGHNDMVFGLSFQPGDGKVLATSGLDKTVRFWDVKAGKLLSTSGTHPEAVRAVDFTPDGKSVVSTTDGGDFFTWEAPSAKSAGTLPIRPHKRVGVKNMTMSPDGRWFVTGCRDASEVRVWDVLNKKLVATLPAHGTVDALAFHPTGKLLVTGSYDGTLHVWDCSRWQPLDVPLKVGDEIHTVAFHPNGQILATGGKDGVLRLWRFAREQPEMQGDVAWLRCWAEVRSGLELTAEGALRPLAPRELEVRQQKLLGSGRNKTN